MYFKDHTIYNYYLDKSIDKIVNIGWLSSKHIYQLGYSEPEFIEKLTDILISNDISDYKFNRMRGNHVCNICEKHIYLNYVDKNNHIIRKMPLGFCELLIPSQLSDQYYASPSLIFHYIQEHSYKPPQEYIDSVMALDLIQPFNAQHCFNLLNQKD